MKTVDGFFKYCYSGQAAVDADHQVIVATELNNVPVDVQQLKPMIKHTVDTVGAMLDTWSADTGYCSTSNTSKKSRPGMRRSSSSPPGA